MSLLRKIAPADPRLVGEEPDYRFTLANERTFLAWIRTALALAAGGLGVLSLLPEFAGDEVLGVLLLGVAFVTAATAYRRWARNEQAIRLGQPLPASSLPLFMAIGTALVPLVVVALVIVDRSL